VPVRTVSSPDVNVTRSVPTTTATPVQTAPSQASEVAAAVGSGIVGQSPQPGPGPIGGVNPPPTTPSGPVGTPVGGERPIGPIGPPGVFGGPIGIVLPPIPVRGPIGLPPLPPPRNMWGGPVGIARPPVTVGGGLGRPIFGGVVNPPVGLRGRLFGPPGGLLRPFTPPTRAGGGRPWGPILVSERIGRYAGGGLYGPPPVLTPYRPPEAQGPPEVAGGGLQLPGAAQAETAAATAIARANAAAAQNVVNMALTQTATAGGPVQLRRATANVAGAPAAAGRVITIVGPAGAERAINLGGLNSVTRTTTQGQVATAGGVATEQNVQNPLLTRYLNEVYAPLVVQTVGRPTTIVARRTVGNVGSVTVGNVQGGVTISGPQGSVYIPAQELLAAATG